LRALPHRFRIAFLSPIDPDDRGGIVRIGYVLPLGEDPRPGIPASTAEVLAFAEEAETAGFDSLWTFDHLLVRLDSGGEELRGTWEAWTMLTAIAVRTHRVKLGVLVSCTGFREPIITAKIAHTLHEISDGRLVLGLGAGWYEPEYRAFGIPFDHRASRFAEATHIITSLIRDGSSDFTGRYHRTVDAQLLPAVPGRPRPPVLIAGRGPRMLRLTAQYADAGNVAWFGLPNPRFEQRREQLRAACEEVGRDPSTLQISVGVEVAADDAPADAIGLRPEPAALREGIAAWRNTGVDEILFVLDPPTMPRLHLLAEALAG
jgi:alkanesulfonate monooxygenase SsuD/methylene tetrahydromethanopterin reductase-like flavin-dependent oxidoreductase (luciferase family)